MSDKWYYYFCRWSGSGDSISYMLMISGKATGYQQMSVCCVRRDPDNKSRWQWCPIGDSLGFGSFITRRGAAEDALRRLGFLEERSDSDIRYRPVPPNSGEGAIYSLEYLHRKYEGYNNPSTTR